MTVLPVVILFAVFSATVVAEPSLTFPEVARGVSSRIVSGWEAVPGQFPFQLSLRMVSPIGGVTACGGSIIHSQWGLTAAHCTATRVSVVIRAGTVNLTQPVYIFETSEYYNHPLYVEALQSVVQPNDIGVIKFGRTLIFNDYVKPIRIQSSESRNRNYQGVRLTASGWGRTWTAPEGGAPENLNWVFLSGTSNQFCWASFGGSSIIQDSTICASGYNVTSQSTCQGDSGGPLTVVDEDGEVTEVGVASFVSGTGCHTDFPAGFIRPGHYHDWFNSVTGIDFDWELLPETTTTESGTTDDNTTLEPEPTTESGTTDDNTTLEPEPTTESGNTDDNTTPEPESTTESGNTDDNTTLEPELTTESGTTDDNTTLEPEPTTESGTTDDNTTLEPEPTTESGNTDDNTTPEPESTTESGNTDDNTTLEPELTTESGTTGDNTTPEPTTESGTTDDNTTPEPTTESGTTDDNTTPEPEPTTESGNTDDNTTPEPVPTTESGNTDDNTTPEPEPTTESGTTEDNTPPEPEPTTESGTTDDNTTPEPTSESGTTDDNATSDTTPEEEPTWFFKIW